MVAIARVLFQFWALVRGECGNSGPKIKFDEKGLRNCKKYKVSFFCCFTFGIRLLGHSTFGPKIFWPKMFGPETFSPKIFGAKKFGPRVC